VCLAQPKTGMLFLLVKHRKSSFAGLKSYGRFSVLRTAQQQFSEPTGISYKYYLAIEAGVK